MTFVYLFVSNNLPIYFFLEFYQPSAKQRANYRNQEILKPLYSDSILNKRKSENMQSDTEDYESDGNDTGNEKVNNASLTTKTV